ncbi:heme transporter HRG1-like [Paramacrobiotus metropolitanus]|uniref:heme transporter HRG1-like n=1 Tax=Paramacrobiotus metropolitanus TaxID=2943436 RepID=UPI002445C9F6|nr:heme transporter HRG1-like [Paramacrobiotus metropolitanus]XP_055355156.1 heme transporter HRG1-like [Paramacrobiotus metropolitanus]
MVKVVVVPGRKAMILRMAAAALGISAGLMVALYFIGKKNWNIVFWGFFSALWAVAALLLHIFYKRGKLAMYSSKLTSVIYTGIVGQVIGVIAFIVYIVLGAVHGDNLSNMETTEFVASVWGFMTWKWAFVLWWYGRQYRHIVLEEALIPVEDDTTIVVEADTNTVIKAPEVVA